MRSCSLKSGVALGKQQSPVKAHSRVSTISPAISPAPQPVPHSRFVKMQSALEKVKARLGASHAPEAGLSVSR